MVDRVRSLAGSPCSLRWASGCRVAVPISRSLVRLPLWESNPMGFLNRIKCLRDRYAHPALALRGVPFVYKDYALSSGHNVNGPSDNDANKTCWHVRRIKHFFFFSSTLYINSLAVWKMFLEATKLRDIHCAAKFLPVA